MKVERKKFLTIAIAATLAVFAATGCNFQMSVGIPKEPNAEDLQKMVKETIADFSEAVEKNDFKGLRQKTSESFQQQFSVEQVQSALAGFSSKKEQSVALFAEAQKSTAEFSPQPQMREADKNYFVETKGKIPAGQQALNFHFEYIREDGKWKLNKFQLKA